MARKKARRKHKRFQVPQGAFAGLGPDFDKIGQIMNISMGGLAFRYVGREGEVNRSQLDIIMVDPDFYLSNVLCKTVSDFAIVDGTSFNSTRRACIKFEKLTHYQKVLLGHFIENHTTGEV